MKTRTIPFTAKNWKLLPPPPGSCPDCAVKHDPSHPHNAQSMHYQYSFYLAHQRFPTWIDAMAHCDETMKNHWTKALTEKGVDVAGGKVNP